MWTQIDQICKIQVALVPTVRGSPKRLYCSFVYVSSSSFVRLFSVCILQGPTSLNSN